ncbi:MAG: acetyl-CoA carboxylase biotin carboxyl carrier protein [Holosporaceae bacterium]|nr:MAG: acetyl-CoA carboxylase biotin carboxyl carrier protein [Holosporaceae bacterium]
MNTKKENKSSPKSNIKIDSEAVRELASLFKENDLSEIEYEVDGCRIRVARQQALTNYTVPPMHAPSSAVSQPLPSPEKSDQESAPKDISKNAIRSPMVGTAYLSPKPGDPAFTSVGATVTEGQTLMIIEAMKVMNPLKAAKSGKVSQIFVEDGQPVEFDQPLIVIE